MSTRGGRINNQWFPPLDSNTVPQPGLFFNGGTEWWKRFLLQALAGALSKRSEGVNVSVQGGPFIEDRATIRMDLRSLVRSGNHFLLSLQNRFSRNHGRVFSFTRLWSVSLGSYLRTTVGDAVRFLPPVTTVL